MGVLWMPLSVHTERLQPLELLVEVCQLPQESLIWLHLRPRQLDDLHHAARKLPALGPQRAHRVVVAEVAAARAEPSVEQHLWSTNIFLQSLPNKVGLDR